MCFISICERLFIFFKQLYFSWSFIQMETPPTSQEAQMRTCVLLYETLFLAFSRAAYNPFFLKMVIFSWFSRNGDKISHSCKSL